MVLGATLAVAADCVIDTVLTEPVEAVMLVLEDLDIWVARGLGFRGSAPFNSKVGCACFSKLRGEGPTAVLVVLL